jgi:hypothetical protein
MPTYRLYIVTPAGRIAKRAEIVECADDEEAIQAAERAMDGQDIEVWNDARLVLRLSHN